jgi:hypothetical protein
MLIAVFALTSIMATPAIAAVRAQPGTTVGHTTVGHTALDPAVARPDGILCWWDSTSRKWICNGNQSTPVYSMPDLRVVGVLSRVTNGYTCRIDTGPPIGGPHPNRWLYTQADNLAWGWVKDTALTSDSTPVTTC